MELFTALGLSSASGLNAYVPMLILGLTARFTDWITLPAGWTWLSDGWLLGIVAVLLVIELVADKIPAVDSVNDWIQTLVRPTSGGIMFASSLGTSQIVGSSAAFQGNGKWVAVGIGAVIALVLHLVKSWTRPAANVATAGVAAPVLSTGGDLTAVALSFAAVLAPILVILILVGLFFAMSWALKKWRGVKLSWERDKDAAADEVIVVDDDEVRFSSTPGKPDTNKPPIVESNE